VADCPVCTPSSEFFIISNLVSCFLPIPEFHINGTIYYVLLLLHIPMRTIHVIIAINSLLLLISVKPAHSMDASQFIHSLHGMNLGFFIFCLGLLITKLHELA
jgi:hypothetical protein